MRCVSFFYSRSIVCFSTMFYSAELLSLRRKGKLARCWLAATVSERMFKQSCKPALIRKIDVSILCEEILSTIDIRGNRSYGRFSLYLSSQLMYGVTRILLYQTIIFQDYLFEVNRKLDRQIAVKRYRDEFNVAAVFELPEPPPLNEVLRGPEISSNLHLIVEDNYTSAIEHLMQDEMNFGLLTNFEVEQLIPSGMEELNEIRRFRWDESEEMLGESVKIPLVDVSKPDTIESETETRSASARRDQRESLVDTEDQALKQRTPGVPIKRTSKLASEIPAKRRKTSPEEILAEMVPFEHPPSAAPVSEFALDPELVPAPACELQTEMQQELPTLESAELVELTKKKRRRKFIDNQIQQSDTIMRRMIENITAHTRKQQPFTTTLLPAEKYLMQSSIQILNKLWAQCFTELFNRNLIGPSIARNEVFHVRGFEMEETIFGETIRAELSGKSREQMNDQSKIAITTAETTEHSKMIETTFPIPDYQTKEVEEHQIRGYEDTFGTKELEETFVPVPEISEEKIRETMEKQQMSVNKKKLRRASKSSSSICSKTYLAKSELLAMLEVHWRESSHVSFHNLISPSTYAKIDASCAFHYCLEFHAEKVLILKQAEHFQTIWIEKYPNYTSESGESFAATRM